MWKKSESKIMPQLIDDTSSPTTVYIRKNVEEVVRKNENRDDETIYVYDEQEVKKEDWEIYRTVLDHSDELSEVEDALVELASLLY